MKILIPVDAFSSTNNSIIEEVSNAVIARDSSFRIDQNIPRFWEGDAGGYDCVHIHWPEALLRWDVPDEADLLRLDQRLKQWKEHTRIIVTVHNLVPHNFNPLNQKLYTIIYKNADVFIHMSKISRTLLCKYYPGILPESVQHVIIPHGLYEIFDNSVSRQEARERLNLRPDHFVVLVLGRARNEAEEQVVKRVIDHFPCDNRKIIATQWDLGWREKAFFLKKSIDKKHYRLLNAPVPVNELQYYLNAGDVLLIQRRHSLNSGCLIMGFAFGKVIVGPDYGSMGEILRETKNPVYDPDDVRSVIDAVEEGRMLSKSDKGLENLKYAKEHWNLNLVAGKHIDLYKKRI